MKRYLSKQLTQKQVQRILKRWGSNAVFYAENNNGGVYWNKSTGEILWYSSLSTSLSNAELL